MNGTRKGRIDNCGNCEEMLANGDDKEKEWGSFHFNAKFAGEWSSAEKSDELIEKVIPEERKGTTRGETYKNMAIPKGKVR